MSLRSIKSKGWDGSVRGRIAKDTLSKGYNIQEFLVGDTSVGDGLTLHQFSHTCVICTPSAVFYITINAPLFLIVWEVIFLCGDFERFFSRLF